MATPKKVPGPVISPSKSSTSKSPIGPGSGYLQPSKPSSGGTARPSAIKPQPGILPSGRPPSTGTKPDTKIKPDTGIKPDTSIKPLTFTDTDNGDGTITRRYSDGTVEIIAGGRGVGQGTDPATTELLRC